MTKKGAGKVTYNKQELELKFLTAIDEALGNPEIRDFESVNPTFEIYVVKDANKMLPVFPKDPDGSGYMLPLDVYPTISAFVYYGDRIDDFPKMVVVLDNIADKPAYVRNCRGIMSHEIGHLLSWNNKIKHELKDGIENVLGDTDVNHNDIVEIVSQIRAEAIAIDAGYAGEMLDLRKANMKQALRYKLIYEHEVENIMTLYASFRLVANTTKDDKLKKEASLMIKKLDSDLPKKLDRCHDYYNKLRTFTLWAVDDKKYNDSNAIYKKVKELF